MYTFVANCKKVNLKDSRLLPVHSEKNNAKLTIKLYSHIPHCLHLSNVGLFQSWERKRLVHPWLAVIVWIRALPQIALRKQALRFIGISECSCSCPWRRRHRPSPRSQLSRLRLWRWWLRGKPFTKLLYYQKRNIPDY